MNELEENLKSLILSFIKLPHPIISCNKEFNEIYKKTDIYMINNFNWLLYKKYQNEFLSFIDEFDIYEILPFEISKVYKSFKYEEDKDKKEKIDKIKDKINEFSSNQLLEIIYNKLRYNMKILNSQKDDYYFSFIYRKIIIEFADILFLFNFDNNLSDIQLDDINEIYYSDLFYNDDIIYYEEYDVDTVKLDSSI
jgi:hypothetical protein